MSKKGAQSVEALHLGAMKALKKAVEKAIAQHELAGVPAAIWRDGRFVLLSGRRKKNTLKKPSN